MQQRPKFTSIGPRLHEVTVSKQNGAIVATDATPATASALLVDGDVQQISFSGASSSIQVIPKPKNLFNLWGLLG